MRGTIWYRSAILADGSYMRVFHRTDAAEAILRSGFQDGRGSYMTDRERTGVWVSDVPLDINEGARGDVLLSIEVPEEVIIPFEWIEEGKPYREFLVPSSILNSCGPPRFARSRPSAMNSRRLNLIRALELPRPVRKTRQSSP
jgi:hypothetical protein